jgi:hypothetical protein
MICKTPLKSATLRMDRKYGCADGKGLLKKGVSEESSSNVVRVMLFFQGRSSGKDATCAVCLDTSLCSFICLFIYLFIGTFILRLFIDALSC